MRVRNQARIREKSLRALVRDERNRRQKKRRESEPEKDFLDDVEIKRKFLGGGNLGHSKKRMLPIQ